MGVSQVTDPNEPTYCHHRGCGKRLKHETTRGRQRLFCDAKCRSAARREREAAEVAAVQQTSIFARTLPRPSGPMVARSAPSPARRQRATSSAPVRSASGRTVEHSSQRRRLAADHPAERRCDAGLDVVRTGRSVSCRREPGRSRSTPAPRARPTTERAVPRGERGTGPGQSVTRISPWCSAKSA